MSRYIIVFHPIPHANFFRGLGLFAQDNFLARANCAELGTRMSKGEATAGVIFGEKSEAVLELVPVPGVTANSTIVPRSMIRADNSELLFERLVELYRECDRFLPRLGRFDKRHLRISAW